MIEVQRYTQVNEYYNEAHNVPSGNEFGEVYILYIIEFITSKYIYDNHRHTFSLHFCPKNN